MLGFNARRPGFTLVDTMIVVLILAILAAIVAPKFTEAVDDSRDAALCTDLHMLRQQTLLYITQHGGRGPHLKPRLELGKRVQKCLSCSGSCIDSR